MESRFDVCYLVSHGFAARMVLHSDVIPNMRDLGLRVAVVMPNAEEPQMRDLAERQGFSLFKAPDVDSRRRNEYQRLRRYLFEDVRANPALWSNHVKALHKARGWPGRLRLRLFYAVNRAVVASSAIRRALSRLERRALANPEVAAILQEIRPRIVIATYPVSPIEGYFLHEAERAGIPTVGHLLSWDNVTTKGRFPAPPQTYIAWGPIMAAEIEEYYGPLSGGVYECGVPHFDAHIRAPNDEGRREALREMGLDPRRPYLFFGMSAPAASPHEIDIVEWLAGRVKEGHLGEEMQLLIRPHPQNMEGHLADAAWLPRIDALRGDGVAVDYPELEASQLDWNMKEQDLIRLVNIIAGCAVCLNSGSTITIDALLHDKPVVLTGFDAGKEVPWWASTERGAEYPHLAKLIGLGGVRIARSFEDLEAKIQAYLDDPTLDAAERAATRAAECGVCDGRASERVAAAAAGLAAEAGWRPQPVGASAGDGAALFPSPSA